MGTWLTPYLHVMYSIIIKSIIISVMHSLGLVEFVELLSFVLHGFLELVHCALSGRTAALVALVGVG